MAVRPSAIVGGTLGSVGVLGMYGALTGRLPAMIGAIWYPNLLTNAPPPKSTNTGGLLPKSGASSLLPGTTKKLPGGLFDPLNWFQLIPLGKKS